MVFWGAPLRLPDHPLQACYSAIAMQLRLIEMRKKWKKEFRPLLHVRMGINTGDMLVGNLGSSQRMDYTVMGDAVNLAARLEGANKFYETQTMISETTYQQTRDFVDTREIDCIRVVGKKEPVTVYQLLARKNQKGRCL